MCTPNCECCETIRLVAKARLLGLIDSEPLAILESIVKFTEVDRKEG